MVSAGGLRMLSLRRLELSIGNCSQCPYIRYEEYHSPTIWCGHDDFEEDKKELEKFDIDNEVHPKCPLPCYSFAINDRRCAVCGSSQVFYTPRDRYPFECAGCHAVFN